MIRLRTKRTLDSSELILSGTTTELLDLLKQIQVAQVFGYAKSLAASEIQNAEHRLEEGTPNEVE
jgi:hypothetical protein